MVLSDGAIKEEIQKGNITITGFQASNLGPCTYDMTLGSKFQMYRGGILDAKMKNTIDEFEVGIEGVLLEPGELYLYTCNETIGLKGNLCATVMGKSSLGRLGLDIHICAGFIDPGFHGSLVLEMRTIYPLRVYPGMKICQIKFERL